MLSFFVAGPQFVPLGQSSRPRVPKKLRHSSRPSGTPPTPCPEICEILS